MSTPSIVPVSQSPDFLGIGTDLRSTIFANLTEQDLKIIACVCKAFEETYWRILGQRGQLKAVSRKSDSDDLRPLEKVRHLKRITLSGNILVSTLEPLFTLQNANTFESLIISESKKPLTVTAFKKMAKMPALAQLQLRSVTFNPIHLQSLTQIRDLHLINVGMIPAKPETAQKLLETLAKIPNLQILKIINCQYLHLDADNVGLLATLTRLHTLSCDIAKWSGLRCLVAMIKALPSLKTVTNHTIESVLSWWNSPNTPLRIVEQLQRLNTLNRYEIDQLLALQEERGTTLFSYYQKLSAETKQLVLQVIEKRRAFVSDDLHVRLLSPLSERK